MENIVEIGYNAGFFSCSTVRLKSILTHYNDFKTLPIVDSSTLWPNYKDKDEDITPYFFKTLDDIFEIQHKVELTFAEEQDQFSDYSKLNFEDINPFIKKYFTPSDLIMTISNDLINKYHIDVNKTIAILYRGNDKFRETIIPDYQVMEKEINLVLNQNPDHKLLIQSDELDFYEYMKPIFPNAITIDEAFKMKKQANAVQFIIPLGQRTEHAKIFLSIMQIISKCDHVILNSGNVGMWVCLFRNSKKNVDQFLMDKFL